MSFAIFKSAYRQNEKERGQTTMKKNGKRKRSKFTDYMRSTIWNFRCRFFYSDCFTDLSKRGGWICLFSKSICIYADIIIEPYIILDYVCFNYCSRYNQIVADKIQNEKM